MRTNWEDNVKKVTPYVPGVQKNIKNLIKLNTNENPYPPAPAVEEILKKYDSTSLRKYPEPNVSVLVNAIAKYHNVDASKVFVGVGSDDVLAMGFTTFFNSTKPIFFPDITYSFYDVWADFFGIKYETKPLDKDFVINVSDYLGENGGVVIANPNAPTGMALGLGALEKVLEANRDVVVIIDEAYVDFGGDTALPLVEEYDNLLVTRTFSKSRSLAGARIGYAIGSSKLISYLWAARNAFNSYTITALNAEIAVASIEDDDYFKKQVSKIKDTREAFKESLGKLGFTFPDSKANFVFAKHNNKRASDIFEYLNSKNILVRYFNRPGIDNYLRITIGTDEEMKAVIRAISEIV